MAHHIDTQEVERIATLARLSLGEAERKKAAEDLTGILSHFSAIQDIDTKDVPPADDVSGRQNITREDIAVIDLLCTPQQTLQAAPVLHEGQVRVKAVFS